MISTPLRALIMKSEDWEWNKEQKDAFENLKQSMTKNPALQFYDDTKPIKVSIDACKSGIGAVILQQFDNDCMPIAYASRALSKSEQNHAMIEKELLGVVFDCERFHSRVYDKSTTVETDHTPLIAINSTPLCDAPHRLQRLMLRIQKYDLEIIYTPGAYLVIAGTLFRSYAPLPPGPTSTKDDVEMHICAVVSNLMVTTEKWKEIANKTLKI